jgi:hypothetical protein
MYVEMNEKKVWFLMHDSYTGGHFFAHFMNLHDGFPKFAHHKLEKEYKAFNMVINGYQREEHNELATVASYDRPLDVYPYQWEGEARPEHQLMPDPASFRRWHAATKLVAVGKPHDVMAVADDKTLLDGAVHDITIFILEWHPEDKILTQRMVDNMPDETFEKLEKYYQKLYIPSIKFIEENYRTFRCRFEKILNYDEDEYQRLLQELQSPKLDNWKDIIKDYREHIGYA